MKPLSGSWKKLLILISAGFLLLFVSRHAGSGQGAAAAERPAPAATAAQPGNGPPPPNEIPEFQQLD